MREARRQSRPEVLGEIGRHDLDPGQPARIGVRGPSAQVSGTVALDHVDHHMALEVDEPGRVHGRVLGRGGQARRLVDAELADWADSIRVVDQRCAVLGDRVHDRPPAHAELVGDARDRPCKLTDLAARLPPGATRDDALRIDVVRTLGPGLRVACLFAATPTSLPPHQPSRATEARQVADLDRQAIVRLRARTTRRAPCHRRGRLHRDHELVVRLVHCEHAQPVESQKRFRQPDTVAHRQGSPILVAVEQPRRSRDPWPARWTPQLHVTPHPNAKSRFSVTACLAHHSEDVVRGRRGDGSRPRHVRTR